MLDRQQENNACHCFSLSCNSSTLIIPQLMSILQKLEILESGGGMGKSSFDIYSGVCFLLRCEYLNGSWYYGRGLSHYSTIDLYFKLNESEVKSVSIQQIVTSKNVVFEMVYISFLRWMASRLSSCHQFQKYFLLPLGLHIAKLTVHPLQGKSSATVHHSRLKGEKVLLLLLHIEPFIIFPVLLAKCPGIQKCNVQPWLSIRITRVAFKTLQCLGSSIHQ